MVSYGRTTFHRVTINCNTTPYSAGDAIGTVCAVPNALTSEFYRDEPRQHSGYLQSITVVDESNQKAALSVLFFDGTPSGAVTNNGPWNPATGDFSARGFPPVQFAATDYVSYGPGTPTAVATQRPPQAIELSSPWTLNVLVYAEGSATYAENALRLILGIMQDN